MDFNGSLWYCWWKKSCTSWVWQFIPLFTWLFTSQVVQDFSINSISNPRKKRYMWNSSSPGDMWTLVAWNPNDLAFCWLEKTSCWECSNHIVPTPHILCFQILIRNRTYYKEDIFTHNRFHFIFKGHCFLKGKTKNKTKAANNEKIPHPSLGSYRHNFWLTDKQPPLVSTPGRVGFSCNNAEPPNFSDKVLMARPWQFTQRCEPYTWRIIPGLVSGSSRWLASPLSRVCLVVIMVCNPLEVATS